MPTKSSLQWGRILLSALLAAIIAMAIIFIGLKILGENPGGILDRICPPDLVDCPDTGNVIGDIIVCAILFLVVCTLKLAIYILLFYFPLTALIAFLLIRRMVQQRLLIHTILTVLLSLPIAYLLLWLVSKIAP